MSNTAQPTIVVIIGITGDLSRRKLLPAIEKIVRAGAAPPQLKIVGISRRPVTTEDLLADVAGDGGHEFLADHLDMYQMDLVKAADYEGLKNHLAQVAAAFDTPAQRLFYLSVPPQMSQPIVELLGRTGLARQPDTKLLLEKPFGSDLASARELIEQTRQHFTEAQVYRIDHFLAKEMAQNLVIFRDSNSLFKRTWNKDFIEHIEITASEKIGIEGRAAFYEQTGALRDVVQSHLLQLAALTLMEQPATGGMHDIPARRLRALQQLRIPADKPVTEYARRGQYDGYHDEVQNPGSTVETYVELTLQSDDPQWAGVPVHLVTGKALKEKLTCIRITYKKEHQHESNQLVIKFQPGEGIELALWTKVPGYDRRLEKHSLALTFKDHFPQLPEAYEQVFLDVIQGNHALFTSSDEVVETWRILDPIQRTWEMSAADLLLYKPGSEAGSLATPGI